MKKIVLVVSVVLALVVLAAGGYLWAKHGSDDWKKVSVGDGYYESMTIELDLDRDGVKEKIEIREKGEYVVINDVEYVVNKNLSEDERKWGVNQYHFVDLNGDGVLEIIHRDISTTVSPATNKYTVYNFTGEGLKEIGNVSIIGNIPDEVYVKGNTVKFEYWPHESPPDYTEEVMFELNV